MSRAPPLRLEPSLGRGVVSLWRGVAGDCVKMVLGLVFFVRSEGEKKNRQRRESSRW